MRTPNNILMHELIGLQCEVYSALNPSQKGLKGKVIDETMKNLTLETGNGNRTVPKKGTVFRLRLERQSVDISGDAIISRPEDRIKKKFRKW